MRRVIGAIIISTYLLGAIPVQAAASETAFPGQGVLGDALEDMTGIDDVTDEEEKGVEETIDKDGIVQEDILDTAVPVTGDSQALLLWTGVAAGAVVILAACIVRRKKQN